MANTSVLCSALALVVCTGLLSSVSGHAGHFHGPSTPQTNGSPYAVVKSSKVFRVLPAAKKVVPGGSFPRLEGETNVLYYYYQNCSSKQSSSVQISVKLTNGKKLKGARQPVTNFTMAGMVWTYPCASVLAGRGQFYNLGNTQNLTDPANYLWWQAASTDLNGTIVGHGANSGKPHDAEKQIRSLVFYNAMDDAGTTGRKMLALGSLLEDPKAWRSRALFCADFGGIVEKNWDTKLVGWPGTDC